MRRLIVLVASTFVLGGCASISYDPQKVAYTSDQQAFGPGEIKPLFDRLLRGSEPVVLFVHGRGKEPRKSLEGTGFLVRPFVEGKAVSKLEAYGTKTVLFSWNSQRCGFLLVGLDNRQCPLENIEGPDGGAARFKATLDALAASLTEHRTHPPVTLVAHSMGTIVVQRYVELNDGWAGGRKLFDNVVISSSDATSEGHAAWVEKIAAVERVFVTTNPKDPFLEKSKTATPPNLHPLGLDAGPQRSTRARYVDFDIEAHEIFTRRDDHPEISGFFDAVFKGQAPASPAPTAASPARPGVR
jgi:pimeloyl-ACP methyl ester carboxylesterase